MAKKITEKKEPAKKDDMEDGMNPVVVELNKFIFDNSIPESFSTAYKTSMVMAHLFANFQMGEIFQNIAWQLTRIHQIYKIPTQDFREEITIITDEYIKIVGEVQKKILEKAQELQKQQEKEKEKK